MDQLHLINLEWSINQDLQTFSILLPKMVWLYPETLFLAPNICTCSVMIPDPEHCHICINSIAFLKLYVSHFTCPDSTRQSSSHGAVFPGEFYQPKDVNAGRNNIL